MKKDWKFLPNLYNALISHKQPVYLVQFVTQRCNARCPHCFVDLNSQKEELTLEQIEKLASTSGSCLRNVALTGGEPFIRDDIFEIADIWYKNSSATGIVLTTNGSMPERIENFTKKAIKNNIPVMFFLSYDFIGEKHSEYRRLKDLHLNVVESYKILKSFSPQINATFSLTVNADNYNSAIETYKYMRDTLKIQNINCTMIRGSNAEILTPEQRSKIAQVYKTIQKSLDDDFYNGKIIGFNDKSLTAAALNVKNKIIWKYVLKTFVENKYISPCTAGNLIGVIYSNGDIYPCELLNSKFGSLKDFDYDFLKCWHSSTAKEITKSIKCSKCFCSNECNWLVNIFASPRYYPQISYYVMKDLLRKI